jgi:hypothetical protein
VTFTVSQRGYDGTVPATHEINQATCEHPLAAAVMQLVIDHVDDVEADPHSTKMLNNARHDITTRHQFTGALGVPGTPAAQAVSGSAGSGAAPAREDHVHPTPAGTIVESMIGTGAVTSGKLGALAVIAGKIAPDALDGPGLFAAGVRPVRVSGSTPSVDVQTGDVWLDTGTERLMYYDGTGWRIIGGKMPMAQLAGTTVSSVAAGTHGILGFVGGDVVRETDNMADEASNEFDLPFDDICTYSIWIDSTSATNFTWNIEARLNGTVINTSPWNAHNAVLGGSNSLSGEVLAAAGDVLDFRVFNNAASARDFRFRYGLVSYKSWSS